MKKKIKRIWAYFKLVLKLQQTCLKNALNYFWGGGVRAEISIDGSICPLKD